MTTTRFSHTAMKYFLQTEKSEAVDHRYEKKYHRLFEEKPPILNMKRHRKLFSSVKKRDNRILETIKIILLGTIVIS